ncbi:MAG: hypothetical protein WDN49_17645 [Acetobacteraceae bacterium]
MTLRVDVSTEGVPLSVIVLESSGFPRLDRSRCRCGAPVAFRTGGTWRQAARGDGRGADSLPVGELTPFTRWTPSPGSVMPWLSAERRGQTAPGVGRGKAHLLRRRNRHTEV